MNTTSRNTAPGARVRRYLTDAARAFEHAPVEVSLSVFLAIAFSWMIEADTGPFPDWLELAVVVVLAGAGAAIATLLHALGAWSSRIRWLVTIGVALVAALYGVFLLDLELIAEAWRAAALVSAAVLLILATPSFAIRGESVAAFRRVTGRLLLRTLAVLLYAAALFAGLALALGAVNTLFELDFNARVYAHVLGWIFLVLVPWVVIGGLPDYVRPADDTGAVGSAVHRLSAYLVTPLLAIYYIILYAYALRIAITGELPKNLVSPLVLAAGLIAGIALILFDRPESRAAALRSLRASAPLFVPLCMIGIWALTIRIQQYGWTEFRGLRTVLLLALGALAAAATVMVVRRRSLPLHVLPLALAATLLLSAVGPWSVIAGSRRSQQARLSTALTDAGIEWDATAVRDSVIPNEAFTTISETARYLASHYGADALPPLFAARIDREGRFVDVVYESGLRSAQPELNAPRGGFAQLASGTRLGSDPADALHYVRIERHVASGDTLLVDSARATLHVSFTVDDRRVIADLTGVARSVLSRPHEGGLPPELARVPVRDAAGAERGELFILEIGLGQEDGVTRMHRLIGIVRLVPD